MTTPQPALSGILAELSVTDDICAAQGMPGPVQVAFAPPLDALLFLDGLGQVLGIKARSPMALRIFMVGIETLKKELPPEVIAKIAAVEPLRIRPGIPKLKPLRHRGRK